MQRIASRVASSTSWTAQEDGITLIYVQTYKSEERSHSSSQGVQVISRAAAIMRALYANRDGMTVGQIAKLVALPRPTVQRIVYALQSEGLMCNMGLGRRVGLGPDLLRLALSVHVQAADVLRPILQRLSRNVQETVNLLTLEERHAVCIEHIAYGQEVQVVPRRGARLPLYCSASGKALLASMPEEKARELVGKEWKPHRHNSKRTWNSLLPDLDTFHIHGVAFESEELIEGVGAVATTVQTNCGTLHAISIPTPLHRFQRKRNLLVASLKQVRREAQQALQRERV